MKWKNKGHEFDYVYEEIEKKSRLYLFGAGDWGGQIFHVLEKEFEIIAFIDNDKSKQEEKICGIPCVDLETVKLKKTDAVVVSMSQAARVSALMQLANKGYQQNTDYFVIEDFLSIYYVYKYDRVYFTSVSFLPSTKCNLNCKNCLNFNPFAKDFFVRDFERVKSDVDLFFRCVDRIMLFHVSGGEPMLYPHIGELLSYIKHYYGRKIDRLRTFTNGTVLLREDAIYGLKESGAELIIDDYREALPNTKHNFDKLIDCLEKNNIRYKINKAESWIDLAPDRTDYSTWTEKQMIEHRDKCGQSWEELREGKLYSCNYASYATVAGIAGDQDIEEAYDLTMFDETKKKELIEFRLGYTTKGYTNFCRKCRGFTVENNEEYFPAEQVVKCP